MTTIDLRSDTVTQPSARMRRAMAEATVGDDVYGEDATINRLQDMAAEMMGKEAALFVCSGTQSNLLALLSHCQRGDEYITAQDAHTYKYEGGGAAVLGSIQPQPLEAEPDGTLDLQRVVAAIKPDDCHFARTRLLCLENTFAGRVLPMEYSARAAQVARRHGLGLHLDGARIFNAAVKLGQPVSAIAEHFDSVSCCLSKGLGAPVGSVLCASRDLIDQARRWRKVLGGGMRQAGIVAAAGIVALEDHVQRLAEDHANALRLAEGLEDIPELRVSASAVQTNMVFAQPGSALTGEMTQYLQAQGVLISGGDRLRLVTHLDVRARDINRVVQLIRDFLATRRGA